MSRIMILAAFVAVVLVAGCSNGFFYLGERRGPYSKPMTYSERKSELKSMKPLSLEQLEKLYGECPAPNGAFNNDSDVDHNVGSLYLHRHFFVEGFVRPATVYPGGKDGDEPLPAIGSPIDLLFLGGEKNSVGSRYLPSQSFSPEKGLILELRPLGLGRFYIGIRSNINGRSAESDRGVIAVSGTPREYCEKGVLKRFHVNKKENKAIMYEEMFVEAESGDIIIHWPSSLLIGKEFPETYIRFKRIGN